MAQAEVRIENLGCYVGLGILAGPEGWQDKWVDFLRKKSTQTKSQTDMEQLVTPSAEHLGRVAQFSNIDVQPISFLCFNLFLN